MFSEYGTDFNRPLWESSKWASRDTIMVVSRLKDSENIMIVYSVWNTDSLYFFFRVSDSDLRAHISEKDHPRLFLDDMVEILIDTQCRKDSCWDRDDIVYHVNLLGFKKDDRGTADCKTDPSWDGNAGIAVHLLGSLNDSTDTDKGYLLSLAFDWNELNLKPVEGLKMGINFANGDNDGIGRRLFDWSGAWPMRSPYAYGDLILK